MLKRLLSLILILTGLSLYSQFAPENIIRHSKEDTISYECKIIIKHIDEETISFNDTTLCYDTRLQLFTATSDSLNYTWEPSGETGEITEEFLLKDTTVFILHGYNEDSTYHCTDSVTLSIFKKVLIEFEQLGFDCPLPSDSIVDTICINRVKLKANITGGYPPYRFNWSSDTLIFNTLDGTNFDSSYVIANLCLNETYSLTISDSICSYTESYDIQPLDMPEIEITVEPDSLFETNPQAVLSFENKSADSISLTSWTWIFPDGSSTNQIAPSYVFTTNDSLVKFTYTTIDNCNDTIIIPIIVKEFELTVPNVFTPNGDGINDRYEIPYLERYISSELMVFNRWGEMVFKDNNYTGNWDGGRLSDGVYFYVLKCKGYWKEDVYKGSVSIYGSRY